MAYLSSHWPGSSEVLIDEALVALQCLQLPVGRIPWRYGAVNTLIEVTAANTWACKWLLPPKEVLLDRSLKLLITFLFTLHFKVSDPLEDLSFALGILIWQLRSICLLSLVLVDLFWIVKSKWEILVFVVSDRIAYRWLFYWILVQLNLFLRELLKVCLVGLLLQIIDVSLQQLFHLWQRRHLSCPLFKLLGFIAMVFYDYLHIRLPAELWKFNLKVNRTVLAKLTILGNGISDRRPYLRTVFPPVEAAIHHAEARHRGWFLVDGAPSLRMVIAPAFWLLQLKLVPMSTVWVK